MGRKASVIISVAANSSGLTWDRRKSSEGYAMIMQLMFVGIPTSDQDRSLKFYTEKLGFVRLR